MTAPPPGPRLVLGVDAGGSHTVALAVRVDCAIAGRGEAGPGNPRAGGFDAAAEQIELAIRAALAAADDASPREIRRGVLGVAGIGRAHDRVRLAEHLSRRLGLEPTSLHVVSDTLLVLPAAGHRWGVALVAGTGSSAFGVSPDGRTALCGGWGYLFGDEGSAFDIGRQALQAMAHADDVAEGTSALSEAILRHFAVADPRAVVPRVYGADYPRSAIAGLAPVVVGLAAEGDREARRIVTRAAEALAQIASGVARRLRLEPDAPLVCAGGLFAAGAPLLGPLESIARREGLGPPVVLEDPPVVGAVHLATGDIPLPRDP